MVWLAEKRLGVAVFANAPESNPARLAFAVADTCLGFPPLTNPPQVAVTGPVAKPNVPDQMSSNWVSGRLAGRVRPFPGQ